MIGFFSHKAISVKQIPKKGELSLQKALPSKQKFVFYCVTLKVYCSPVVNEPVELQSLTTLQLPEHKDTKNILIKNAMLNNHKYCFFAWIAT